MEGLFNDVVDDVPAKAVAEGFVGMDGVSKASRLPPGVVRKGENMWADADGNLQTRPGFKFNSLLNTAPGAGPYRVQGAGYYDTPLIERILAVREGKLYEVVSDANNAVNNVLAGPAPSTTADVTFAQLVDRMFWSDGVLNWSLYNAGWTHGTVTTFSDATAMPTAWATIAAHRFRLFALDPATDKIYASAVGQAAAPADWVKTDNIRVGDGSGDPTKKLISAQSGRLIFLKEASAHWVDTSASAVANWTVGKITGLTGCIEGKTGVEIGQDIYFLSRYGVVSLGQLQLLDSISQLTPLSAPMQPYIDRINWSAITTAWATAWGDLYVLALPVDSDTTPTIFLCFNTKLRTWTTPWKSTLPTQGAVAFTGWTAPVIARFAAKQETLMGDNTGRLVRFDPSAEKDESAAATSQEIVSWATLRAFNFDEPDAMKQPFWLAIEWFKSTATSVQVNLVRDGLQTYPDRALNACEIIVAGLRTNNLNSFPIIFPLVFQANEAYLKNFHIRDQARFQEAGIQFVSSAGRMKLRGVRMQAFIDTPVLNT